MPGGAWRRTWIAAAAMAAIAVVGLEWSMRDHGYRPSVKDDEYAWAWQRIRASDGSPRTVAVLGTSRILVAFSPAAFAGALPGWKSVQLAIDGTQPVASLIDLARDPEFRGIAIVETLEFGIAPANWDSQRSYVAAYHRRWRAPGAMLERWLATWIEARLAVLSNTGLRVLQTWGSPPYVTTLPDRTQFADYALTDVAELRRRRLEILGQTPPPPTQQGADAWLADVLRLEPYVAAIRARGGAVVYLRMPTCDERWAADQQSTPRALFWDRLAARTRAIAIHFADHPSLRDFECPDTSHIASKDGPRFTRALIEVLIDRGVFPPGSRAAPPPPRDRAPIGR